jgi:hypothetical protein
MFAPSGDHHVVLILQKTEVRGPVPGGRAYSFNEHPRKTPEGKPPRGNAASSSWGLGEQRGTGGRKMNAIFGSLLPVSALLGNILARSLELSAKKVRPPADPRGITAWKACWRI